MPPRTSVACRRCHARKIRCKAPEGLPCVTCVSASAECQLIDSQRGKYARNRAASRRATTEEAPIPDLEAVPQLDQDLHLGNIVVDAGEAFGAPADDGFDVPQVTPRDGGTASQLEVPATNHTGSSNGSNTGSPGSPGSLYARIAEDSASRSRAPITDTNRSVFLGEAFSLSYVVHNVVRPFLSEGSTPSTRLHFPLVHSRPEDPSRTEIVTRQINHLRARRLLYFPNRRTLHLLLDCYFDAFHPAFPLFDEREFRRAADGGEASLLVLSAVLLIAVSICDEELLELNGFISRHGARSVYFHQAKALYDEDQEPDKVDVITGVFLMSFWWGGPDDQKDSWYWLGIASSLASSHGMHRSTRQSEVSAKITRTWRRIWWSIRIRQNMMSGSIGRPRHIADEDCDVELPELADVEEVIHTSEQARLFYFLKMAELSDTFSAILSSRYSPSGHRHIVKSPIELEAELNHLEERLPSALIYRGFAGGTRGLWAGMLSMAKNYATILLCRPSLSQAHNTSSPSWGRRSKAVAAANEVTRVTEDFLAASVGRLCQIHTIPALFNSLAMHLLSICETSRVRGSLVDRGLAEARSDICMLGLQVLQESWPVGGWVHRLFQTIRSNMRKELDRTPHDASRGEMPPQTPAATCEHQHVEGEPAPSDPVPPLPLPFDHVHGADDLLPLPSSSWPPSPDASMAILSPHRYLDAMAQGLLLQEYHPDMFLFGS